MPAVATLLDSRGALVSLRRTLAPGPPAALACRSPTGLVRTLERRLLDAVVIGQRAMRNPVLHLLRTRFPSLPVVVYAAFRPDDGQLIERLVTQGSVAAIVVEGVDDAVAGDLVRSVTLAAERRALLADGPRLLRLTEEIQRRAWRTLLDGATPAPTTGELASRLGVSREHLSRQFAAGGAPNLKRVIDLVRVITAGQLLANPGYATRDAARLLGFASSSHLHVASRRVAGESPRRLADLGPKGILQAFVREASRQRSR